VGRLVRDDDEKRLSHEGSSSNARAKRPDDDAYFVKESVAPMTRLLVAEVDGCRVDLVWVG
jgi:hypothetical protein